MQGNMTWDLGRERKRGPWVKTKGLEAVQCWLRLTGTRGRCCPWKGWMGFGQLREGNSISPPIPCVPSQGPMSQLTVSRLWVHFAPTLGAAPVHSVELLILYSPFFCDPTKRHFWVFWLFLFLAVSWRAKMQRLSLRSQYLLGQTVPGSIMGSASFQYGDIFVAGGNLFACRCEVVLHLPSK